MILCISSGRLLIGDPCYFDRNEIDAIASGNPPDEDYIEIRVPNTAIVEHTEKEGRVASISLVFFQEDDGRPEVIKKLGVDTAQLVFADATEFCARWEEEEYKDIRVYRHKTDGRTLQYRVDFPHYEAAIPSEGGQTMNQLNANGEWEPVKIDEGDLKVSYNGLCKCHDDGIGMIGDRILVTDTGWGDGQYQLKKTMTPDGRIARLTMEFIGDEDDEDEDWDQDDEDWDQEEE